MPWRAARTSRALPIPGYDDLDGEEVGTRLSALSQVELAAVQIYERAHSRTSRGAREAPPHALQRTAAVAAPDELLDMLAAWLR